MTDDERSDTDLLTELRLRPELIGVLYERHAGAVYRFLARRVGSELAEDLLSEVYLAALATRKRIVPHRSDSALPWLYGIAGNVLRHHFRRRRDRSGSVPDVGMDWDAVDARIDASAQRSQLHAALDSLSDGERELFLLVAWEGLTPVEAATALGISAVAARSRLHRARHRIQNVLATKVLPTSDRPALTGQLRYEERLI